jgi:hypothetical protein
MLIILLCWIAILFPALSCGLFLVQRLDDGGAAPADNLITSAWLGLSMLALIFLALSIFTPITLAVTAITLCAAFIAPLCSRATRREATLIVGLCGRQTALTLAALALVAAAFASQTVTWYDTGLYHLQAMKWLAQFGTVKGVALTHLRLGFTSSWFALAAPFPAATLGGLCLLLGFAHLALLLSRIWKDRASLPDWFAATAYAFCLPVAMADNGMAVSPSPDLPSAMLAIVIAWRVLLTPNARLLPLLLGLCAFAIKLSTAPLIPVTAAYYLWGKNGILRRGAITSALLIAITLPVVAAGYIKSGCPLFPSPLGCASAPWATGKEKASEYQNIIRAFAQNQGDSSTIRPLSRWLSQWPISQNTGTLTSDALLLFASLLCALWLCAERSSVTSAEWRACAIGVAGVTYVMASAPSLRFGLGFFCIIPALALARGRKVAYALIPILPLAAALLTPYSELQLRKIRLAALALIIAAYAVSIFFARLKSPKVFLVAALFVPLTTLTAMRPHPVKPPALPSSNLPNGNQCWDAPLPCTPEPPLRRAR